MDWPLLLFVVVPVGGVLALVTLVYGGLAVGETRRIRALERLRTVPIAEAVGAGPVVVAGTIEAEDLVRSPVTGEEGVYVVCVLETTITRRRRTAHGFETVTVRRPIGEARLRTSFWVRDDSGRAYVDTDGAELVGTDWEPSERRLDSEDLARMPDTFHALFAEHATELEGRTFVIYTEYVARPGDPVVLEGTAKRMPSLGRGGYRATVTGFSASEEHTLRVENQTLDERIAAIRGESRGYWRLAIGFSLATAFVVSLLWWAN